MIIYALTSMPNSFFPYTTSELASTLRQVIRYGFVGVINNALGYLIYLLVTWLWLEPKVAITFLYPIGATTAYLGHAKYSFSYRGSASSGVWRFVLAQLIGYCVNVVMLFVFYDLFGYPHQLVQAVSIFIVAGILFLLLRYFVFPKERA